MEEGDGEVVSFGWTEMKDEVPKIVDGIEALEHALPTIMNLIEATAWWVHPDTFSALPLWYPEFHRGQILYDRTWTRQISNTRKVSGVTLPARETNSRAQRTLIAALGSRRVRNLTVCHIWGYDNPKFSTADSFTANPAFYTCVGNMIWLPSPLKGVTDTMDQVKAALKYCALNLYPWPSNLKQQILPADNFLKLPMHYPNSWPTEVRKCLPKNTAPFSARVKRNIDKRRIELANLLTDSSFVAFPSKQVHSTLDAWGLKI